MRSNEVSREQEALRPKLLPETIKEQTQESLKTELVRNVLEARLSRLQNYKLTTDSKLWDKSEYTLRVSELTKFIDTIKNETDPKKIDIASASLSLKDGTLVRDELLPKWSSIDELQKIALRLMRADNGTDQVEKVASKSLDTLFSEGVIKLDSDNKAKADITRRTNKHFGEMIAQGVFDKASPDEQNAARSGLEAMYQMRYIAKEYIDEAGGISVPPNLKNVWENYRDSMDIKDEWFNWSDAGKTQVANFLLYDLAPMLVSGGAAGLVGKWALKGVSMLTRMPALANYAQNTSKVATGVRNTAIIGTKVAVAGIEAATFDLTFEALRNQRLFTDKPQWERDLIKNAFGFGFSRHLAGATKFAGIPLDPLSGQLIKQGLIVPAIITGVGVGQKLLANDPDIYHWALEEFLLGAIMIGAFHTMGKRLEKSSGSPEIGIKSIEPTLIGSEVKITTTNGQTLLTKMTDKLKKALSKKPAVEKLYVEPVADGKMKPRFAPPTDIQDVVIKTKKKPTDEVQAPGPKNSNDKPHLEWNEKSTDATWTPNAKKVEVPNPKMSPTDAIRDRLNAIPKWTGEMGIKIGNTEYTINRHTDSKIDVTSAGSEVKTYNSIDEFLGTFKIENKVPNLSNPKRGDIITLPDGSEWRYTANGQRWQKLDPDSTWVSMDYTEGVQKTTTEMKDSMNSPKKDKSQSASPLVNQSDLSHSNTVDPHAQSRINWEHNIEGPRIRQADLLGGSFRTQIAEMLKMDDATFQKNYTQSQYAKWTEGIQAYEKQMYEAVAKVRNMSDAAVIKNADGIINGNQNLLASMKKDPKNSSLWVTDKALIIAENAAVRTRLNDIVSKEVDTLAPWSGKTLVAAIEKWDKVAVKKELEKIPKWPLLALLALLLLLLSKCNGWKGAWDMLTPEAATDTLCGKDSKKEKWEIKLKRTSEDAANITLTEKRRGSLSEKWMKKEPWKVLVKEFKENEALLASSGFAKVFNTMLKNPTIEAVQEVQRWIGMEWIDDKRNQDGILGPITTAKIKEFIAQCNKTQNVPAPLIAAATSSTSPIQSDTDTIYFSQFM